MKKILNIVLCWMLVSGPALGVGPDTDRIHDYSNRYVSGYVETPSVKIIGTAGDGYLQLGTQSANTATPGSGSNDVRVFAKTKKLYTVTDNGSGTAVVAELGSGAGGAGELNYITNGSAATDLTGWTVSDAAKLNLVRTTTAGELPRNTLTPTGIKLISVASADSTNACVYYDFVIDSNDAATSRLLKIQWEQKPLAAAPAATDLVLSLVSSADHTTVLATPQTTAVPIVATQFGTTFVAPATTTASLRVCTPNNMDDNAGLVLSNIIVGPGSLVQGFPGTVWTSFGTAPAPASFGSVTSPVFKYRRVGDSMEVIGSWVNGTRSAASASLNMPTGFTIDTSKLPSSGQKNRVGDWEATGGGSPTIVTAKNQGVLFVDGAVKNALWFAYSVTDGAGYAKSLATNVGGADTESVMVKFTVPIAEWSSPLYISSGADNNVTPLNWTAYTPTLTSYGFGAGTTSSLEYKRDGQDVIIRGLITHGTTAAGNLRIPLPTGLTKADANATNTVGGFAIGRRSGAAQIGYFRDADSDQSFRIFDGKSDAGDDWQAGNGKPFTGAAWGTNDTIYVKNLRVRISNWTAQDYLGKMLVGFGTAKVGQSGLVNNDSSNTSGTAILGATDGSAASAGYVGEMIGAARDSTTVGSAYSTTSTTGLAGSTTNVCSVTLNKGAYLVGGSVQGTHADGSTRDAKIGLAINSVLVTDQPLTSWPTGTWKALHIPMVPIVIKTDGQTVSIRGDYGGSGTTSSAKNELWVVRIR